MPCFRILSTASLPQQLGARKGPVMPCYSFGLGEKEGQGRREGEKQEAQHGSHQYFHAKHVGKSLDQLSIPSRACCLFEKIPFPHHRETGEISPTGSRRPFIATHIPRPLIIHHRGSKNVAILFCHCLLACGNPRLLDERRCARQLPARSSEPDRSSLKPAARTRGYQYPNGTPVNSKRIPDHPFIPGAR